MSRKKQQSVTTDSRYLRKRYLNNLTGVITPENSALSLDDARNAAALRAQNSGAYHTMRVKLSGDLKAAGIGSILWAGAMALGSELVKDSTRNSPLGANALQAKYTAMGLPANVIQVVLASVTGQGSVGATPQASVPVPK